MNETAATLLSIAMLAGFLLVGAGLRVAWTAEHRKQGLLMVAAGLVLMANVLVWTI